MKILLEQLNQYRAITYRTNPNLILHSPKEAVDFINQRGFAFLWPIKDVEMPNLWSAVAGDRPVADDHDDPGHISWGWKDEMLDKRAWYYARLLKNRNTFVSNEFAPFFYALTPNYGSPEEDFYDQYQQGQLPQETKLIFETLLKEGPLDTLSLRKKAHLSGKSSNTPFTKALDILQSDMRVLPVSIADAGRWHYAFVYELTHRYLPELGEQARAISEKQARMKLVEKYLESVGATSFHQVHSLFRWSKETTERTLDQLVNDGQVISGIELEGSDTPGFASIQFVSK
jgi:hypothetical protein